MKKVLIIFLLFSLIIVFGCAKTPVFGYDIKAQDDPCPENQKMLYGFTGAEFVESGCEDIAPDAGKICKKNDECIHSCFVTRDYLAELGCERDLCSGQKECRGIRGRCEATAGEFQTTLPEKNVVEYFCAY